MITMADSITPANLPPGYSAYLGYVDGHWATAAALRAKFPAAHILTLTVLGTVAADGCDREPGDLSASTAVAWAKRRIGAGAWRPVIYASASNMAPILGQMAADGVGRSQVRLLSAHYGAGRHICGPSTCRQVSTAMDGTQWTDSAPGVGGTRIDASLLVDGFFGGSPVPSTNPAHSSTNWQETMMHALPTLKEGTSGAQVRTVQGLLLARGCSLTLDGVFGPATAATVARFQGSAHLSADGVVGPHTWPALMDV